MAKKNTKPAEQKKPDIKTRNPKQETRNYPWWAKNSGAFFLITLVTFVLYFNTLHHKYSVDDAIVITENMYTQQGAKGISDILTHDTFLGFFKVEKNLVAGGRYRPLSLVTFALEKEYFGDSPHTSHFINVLLYALCGIFIYLMLQQLFKNADERISKLQLLPLITTLLFIAHPIHTEAVANIKGRDEIMSMLFCSIGSWLLLQYMDSGKSMMKMILSFVCFFLGMLSKENAVTFFLVIPMMWWLFRKAEMKSIIQLMIPLAAATVIFLILRQSFTHTSINKEVNEIMNNPFFGMTVSQKFATIIFTFGKYLWLLLVPLKLTSDYYPFEIKVQSFSSVWVIVTLLISVAAIVIAIMQLKKQPLISFSIIFFGLTFSVVSNLVFPIGTFMNERFLFMPSLGFCLLLGYGIIRFSEFLLKRENLSYSNPFHLAQFSLAAFSIMMLGYSGRTIARNPAWKDNFTLFMTDIHNSPNSAKINNAAGGELIAQSDKDTDPNEKKKKINQAKIYLKKALELYPKYSNAYLLLGNAYFKGDKDYAKSFHYYKQGMVMYPGYTLAYNNMKILMGNWKDYNAQRDSIMSYLKESPNDPVPYYFLGSLMENLNKPDSALLQYKKALTLVPGFAEALLQTGMIYGKYFNKLDSSVFYLEKSIKANPDIAESYENLGTAYGMQQNLGAAITILNEGLKRFPNDSKLYYNLGVSYQISGNTAKAKECMDKSKQLEQSIKTQ
ncbi:hypothetical protein LBMAG27_13300 [Bacteroidota bacterium]|nr:hypothetical protein LBMAG27_13300 [Bacteroidota bacterium]